MTNHKLLEQDLEKMNQLIKKIESALSDAKVCREEIKDALTPPEEKVLKILEENFVFHYYNFGSYRGEIREHQKFNLDRLKRIFKVFGYKYKEPK